MGMSYWDASGNSINAEQYNKLNNAGNNGQFFSSWADYEKAARTGGVFDPLSNIQNAASKAAQMADPWASQRGQYQTSLNQLMQNPGSAMQNNPFFKWQQQQGEQAVARQAAAQGQNYSGNKMMALSDYAQKQSGNNFFQLADLYSTLAGAKVDPSVGASLYLKGQTDASQYPLQKMQAQAQMTSANNPMALANQQMQGLQSALNQQRQDDFWRRLSVF